MYVCHVHGLGVSIISSMFTTLVTVYLERKGERERGPEKKKFGDLSVLFFIFCLL